MPVFKTEAPKINKVVNSITVKECEIEGVEGTKLIIENKDKVPHKHAAMMLLQAAEGIMNFLKMQQ